MKSRRTFLVLCATAGTVTPPATANEAGAVDAFRRFIESATQANSASQPPYLNSRRNQWAKRRYEVRDLKYDVRRTDSLVNPILGVVSFAIFISQTPLFDTQEEAADSTAFDSTLASTYQVRLNYTYKDGVWTLRDGEFESNRLRGSKFELTAAKIEAEPNSIPAAPLRSWIQSR